MPAKSPEIIGRNLTAGQVAEVYGVTNQAVGQWSKKEGCPRNKNGTYNLSDVIAWREAKLRAQITEEKSKHSGLNARDRLAELRADSLEFELALRKGQFVAKTEVESTFAKLGTQFKASVESLPRELAGAVYGKKRPEILHILSKRLNALLLRFTQ